MRFLIYIMVPGCLLLFASSEFTQNEDWGFYGHREINKHAVFTCPPPLVGFYKKHINYITEHAVDPDKRRHASTFEAIKHYIDIDHWGELPFTSVPRSYSEAIFTFGKFRLEYAEGEDYHFSPNEHGDTIVLTESTNPHLYILKDSLYSMFSKHLFPLRYSEIMKVDFEYGKSNINGLKSISIVDSFSSFGILPYSLLETHHKLIYAFEDEDYPAILRLSADYGHYIADAHVPLHTTENYDGQLTGQNGIHAFWESRIPELYAENEFDLFVGKAEFVKDLESYIWEIVLDSHSFVDQVLNKEMELRNNFPIDQQYCFDERNDLNIRTQCPEYAKAYQIALGTMIEDRFRSAIKSTGDLWYTAWVQAGRPDLSMMGIDVEQVAYDTIKFKGKVVGRPH